MGTLPSAELFRCFQNTGNRPILALPGTRCILEPELATPAAEHGTNKKLNETAGLARQMEEEDKRGNDFAELDVLFLRPLAQATQNLVLDQFIESMSDLTLEDRQTIL
jgi:DNA-binding FadR family transcriptional regulator